MNHISQLKEILGDRQTGIKFNITKALAYNSPIKPMKFCEAFISSIYTQILLRPKYNECNGTQRAFGFYHNDQKFASLISEDTQIPFEFIQHSIWQIPIIDFPLNNILLGQIENSDLIIALVKPNIISKPILLYAKLFKEKPVISPSFIMSVCANIAEQTYLTKKNCISFGCPESKEELRVLKNEVIVGISASLINEQSNKR